MAGITTAARRAAVLEDRKVWGEVEMRARDAAIAELIAIEDTPLAAGDYVAWSEVFEGMTDGLSAVHRYAADDADGVPRTRCGLAIPEPMRRLRLTKPFIRAHARCVACAYGDAKL